MPAAIALVPVVLEAVQRGVSVLSSSGTWLTGGQRVAVVERALVHGQRRG